MANKKQKGKAKATAAAPQKLRAIFASVSAMDAAPSEDLQKYTAYTCANCSTSFAFNTLAGEDGESVNPFCVDCGSQDTASVEACTAEVLTDADSISTECGNCKTTMAFSTATQATLNGSINCVACGSDNEFLEDKQEDASGGLPVEDDVDLDDVNESAAGAEDEDEDEDDGDTSEDDDIFGTSPDEDGDGIPDDEEEASEDDEDGDDAGEDDEEEAAHQDATGESDGGTLADPTAGDNDKGDNKPGNEIASDEETDELSLVDAVDSDPETAKANVTFARVGNTIHAFVGDVAVASQKSIDVPAQRQAIFASDNYITALANNCNVAGLNATLNDFGFKHTSIKVNASKIGALSEDRVSERAKVIASANTTMHTKELASCMGIAAIGITKGFWPGKQNRNPVRDTMVATLKDIGVRNPERIVDRAFAASGDDYNITLIAKAEELLQMPVDARNAIADAVQGISYAGFQDDDEDEDDSSDSSDPASVARAAVRSPVRRAHASAVATASVENADTQVKGVGQVVRNLLDRHGSLF